MARDEDGFTWIDMPHSALGFRGVAYDEGSGVVLDGFAAHQRPYGCYRGPFDDRAELEAEASRMCIEQPLVMTLEARGDGWSGTLTFEVYKKRLVPPPPSGRPSSIPPPLRAAPGWTVTRTTWPIEIGPASRLGDRPSKQ